MTAARTAALVLTALVFGPLHTIALALCVSCFEQAMAMRRRDQQKNGFTAAAT